VREILDAFPEQKRPAFTTVQTVVYRLEAKRAIRIAKKVGNANVFEPVISRMVAGNTLIDDLLGFFGGRVEPLISRLIESGKLTMDDIKEAEETLRSMSRKEKRK
jgi:predicted transcriptional regulator